MKALLVGILGAVTACVLPPPIQFFTPLPSGQEIIGPLTGLRTP